MERWQNMLRHVPGVASDLVRTVSEACRKLIGQSQIATSKLGSSARATCADMPAIRIMQGCFGASAIWPVPPRTEHVEAKIPHCGRVPPTRSVATRACRRMRRKHRMFIGEVLRFTSVVSCYA